MKKIILLVFMFNFYWTYGQNYEKIVADKMCECFSQNSGDNIFAEAEKCANGKVASEAIIEYYEGRDVKISEEEVKKKANEFDCSGDFDLLVTMLSSCDPFLNMIQSGRELQRLELRKLRSKKYLDSLNNRSLIIYESLILRSQLNFGYDNYDLAERDVEKIKKIYSLDLNGYITLAWIYEKKHEYAKALEIYNELSKSEEGKSVVKPLIVLLKRNINQKDD